MTAKTRFQMIPLPTDFTKPIGREYLRELGRRANQTLFFATGGANSGVALTKVLSYDVAKILLFGGEALRFSVFGEYAANVNAKTVEIRLVGAAGPGVIFSSGAVAINGGFWHFQGELSRGTDRATPSWVCSYSFGTTIPATLPTKMGYNELLIDYESPITLEVHVQGGASSDVTVNRWRGSLSHAP